MPRVRIVFPTQWDRQQLLARPDVPAADCAVVFEGPDDADCRHDLDVLGYIDAAVANWRGSTDGVFSSSDYPGATVAAAIGTALGLPAPAPAAILRAAHKSLSRVVQQACEPAATPAFATIDVDRPVALDPRIGWPCWVKPAKGTFSVLARRIAGPDELRAFLVEPFVHEYRRDFLRIYCELARRYLGPDVDGTAFVAEQELHGRLVTVEGFATDRATAVLGVVDSVRHVRTGSFVAFEYPSTLPAAVQARMGAIARRLAQAFELRWTMFNVEMMWDPATDRIGVVEINPRMCGQFADLYEKVDGVHGYRIALELACGRDPGVRPGPRRAVAASYPLRVFEPVRVLRVPGADDLAAACALFPGTLCWNEVRAGDVLADFHGEDGQSQRYAVINLGAGSAAELRARRDAVVARLGYRFEPVAGAATSISQPPPSAR